MFHIRTTTPADIPELQKIFSETILSVNRKDYTPEETDDWASCANNEARWNELMITHHFLTALNRERKIVGFASVSKDGYLHSLYVHKDFQRRGIATLLYREIEDYVYKRNIRRITSEVSITALPFFEKQGFKIDAKQKRKAGKLYLTNYKMSKSLKSLEEMTDQERWQLFPVILCEYNPDWPKNYLMEQKELEKTIGKDNMVRINHIGSTSVPGLLAKPTIDILLEIKADTNTGELIKRLEKAGYIYSPQPHNPPPHMMFLKGYTVRGFEGQVYHLHIRYAGDWDEFYFRDYLQNHPETAEEYARLKLTLKKEFERDRDSYTQAKTHFIRQVTALARNEFPNRYKK